MSILTSNCRLYCLYQSQLFIKKHPMIIPITLWDDRTKTDSKRVEIPILEKLNIPKKHKKSPYNYSLIIGTFKLFSMYVCVFN